MIEAVEVTELENVWKIVRRSGGIVWTRTFRRATTTRERAIELAMRGFVRA